MKRFLKLLFALLWLHSTQAEVTVEFVETEYSSNAADHEVPGAIDLSARSFGTSIGDGNIWIIEFFSPQCRHCLEFMATYDDIARTYHQNSNQYRIRVARVNGDEERALTSRFGINAYPSFFVVDGWSVYTFDESRNRKNLMNFVEGGYKLSSPIPWYASPMGPLGLMQGTLIATGILLGDFFSWSQKTFGLSPLVTAGILFASAFIGCFFMIVFLALLITSKEKIE